MQASSPISLLSRSSSNPVKGNSQHQCPPHNAVETQGPGASPPTPPQKQPARNTKRHVNAVSKSQRAVQLAKQELRSKLREDWVWPPEPTACLHVALNIPQDESTWQERRDGFDTDSSLGGTVPMDPYQYEDPDSVKAPTISALSGGSKKRKRRQMLLKEMDWNQGLRHFVERRDAWSGARKSQHEPLATARGRPARNSSCCCQSTAEGDAPVKRNAIYATSDSRTSFEAEPFTRPNIPISSSEQLPSVTLIPSAPSILPPDNVVRASITPATYPSIYSKIVVQGLTPTVPINLHDVVGALVKGWKDNDEWPPKSDAERAAFIEGTKGFEGVGDSMNNAIKVGIRRRMGKVKKALHLSGNAEIHDDKEGLGTHETPDNTNHFT